MKYLSIRVKLMILALIILIPLIVSQAININENFKRSSEQRLQASVELADAISASFYSYIKEIWIQESIISEHIASNIDNTNEIQSYLNGIVNDDGIGINKLSWTNPSGIIIASTRKYMVGQSLSDRDYYKRIISGEEKVVSDLVESYRDEALLVPVARAVKKDGKLLGILIYSLDSAKLVSHIPNLKLNKGEVLTLTDTSGSIVYNSLSNNLSFEERKIPKDALTWKALNGEIVKTYKSKIKIAGSYKMGVEYPIKEIGWVCSVISERGIVLKDTYKQAVKSTIILILVSIISLAASYIFGKRISKPLIILKNKADELKQGNYSVRTNIDGYDEIAATAEAFDHMAEGIEEYDKLKGQFFSNLSHEFKTPVNVIYSSTQLIESLQDSLDYQEFKDKSIRNMGVIKQNCYRLMRLIDNMIDVTRYDTGNFKMRLANQNIVSIIENISLSVVKYAEEKGVTLIFDTEVEEKEICCDSDMIERIMLNLISNSLKFTDPGGFIYINAYDKEDKFIFSVRDTGIGMPTDKLSLIFDRFRQLDTSLNRNQEGSGLGLSIVKALVDAHKGNITVSSEIGMGTMFVIELPAAVLCEDNKEIPKTSFEKHCDMLQKIEKEFSDIY